MIGGQSVFSQSAVRERWWQGMKGGLQGSHIVSIEELDAKVEVLMAGPHAEWCDSYLAMMGRRCDGNPTV